MDRLKEFKDKKIMIVGMGRSGIAAAEAMTQAGAAVCLQDSKKYEEMDERVKKIADMENVTYHFGEEPEEEEKFDMLILSPGVPPALEFIQKAADNGAEIIGELELAYRLAGGKFIAITGTNGKTTTTALTGEIFEKSGRKTCVAGNIGIAVVSEVMRQPEDTWFVTETSSFQLETIREFNPVVSALLNITPDHLNRHGDMKGYAAAKANVFANQTPDEFFVVNMDDKLSMDEAVNCKACVVPFSRTEKPEFGAYVEDNAIAIKDKEGAVHRICGLDELKIPGAHNVENALAAAAICFFAGIDEKTIGQAMSEFGGVEHRIENCGSIRGVKFVNDSKGTNPDAAMKALEAIKENIILIAGGYDKNASFDEFVEACRGRVKHIMIMGKTAPQIRDAADRAGFSDYTMCADMEECVNRGFEMAVEGDTILLSPACASWDMYSCFEDRGQHFKDCMNRLKD